MSYRIDSTVRKLTPPRILLLDWHATLVDSLDAMYRAIDDLLPQFEELGLLNRLAPEELSKTPDDVKLVRFVRIFRRLHPKIRAERRVSRTDIFDALFGPDLEAISIAHKAFNECYRDHFGEVKPFEVGMRERLLLLRKLGIRLGVPTNRSREFLGQEMHSLEGGSWVELFDTTVCGDEVTHHKPAPDVLLQAIANLNAEPGADVWYLGDSRTDTIAAKEAGITSIFYNGAMWDWDWLERIFPRTEQHPHKPDAVVDDLDSLLDLLYKLEPETITPERSAIWASRPEPLPPRRPPPPRIEPDWHPAVVDLTAPVLLLFDWHATLVDTLDAMYHAVDDMLPELDTLGLSERLVDSAHSKTLEDAKLVEHVRNYHQLHPKIKADRKISRTDIFEVLFGSDEEAKQIAHAAFNRHYRNHFGAVYPFEPGVKDMLVALRALDMKLGVLTNRDREFFEHELAAVEGTGWTDLFDTTVCGDDTALRKPHAEPILKALDNLHLLPGPEIWYIGDSTTDTIAAKRAGVTSVFFNGAQWDQQWLDKIFPGTERHPHKPDVVVNDFGEFWALTLACRAARPRKGWSI
ncbi:HAD family hydrolase [Sedimenticola selenatireducens]|uniref:HAD family hydrolase n=1 Tax=Sedimenticola selenatireducens TaxID=191960 RepID=UPI0004BA9607|nr:HAD-IA family hydrolase [Sedimenticola selenatireducens]